MKKKLFLLVSVFLGFVVAGCQEDVMLNEPVDEGRVLPEVNMEELASAMHWYEEHQIEQYATRSGRNHPLFEISVPDWTTCFAGENEDCKTVETYLEILNRGLIVTPEAALAYEETKDIRYLRVLTRLIVLTPKKSEKVRGFYMTIVPSKTYLEKTGFRPFANNTYTVRDRELDGYVFYHELDGRLINGWIYEKGKITAAIYGEADDSSIQTRAGTMICTPYYVQTCTDYYYSVNGGADVYNGTSCESPQYVGSDCYATGGTGVGGGGGGVGNGTINRNKDKKGNSTPDNYVQGNNDIIVKPNLPQTMNKQIVNACVTSIMEYINNKVFGGTVNQGVYDLYYFQTYGTKFYQEGVGLDELNDFVGYFFNTTTFVSYKDAIDKGYVVMTDIPSPVPNSVHNVVIIGYQDNGNYIYMDPEEGKWQAVKEGYFKKDYNLVVTGIK